MSTIGHVFLVQWLTCLMISQVCYVAFWDKITLEAQALKGRVLDSNKKIGHWRIVMVENLPFTDQRLNGKIPKVKVMKNQIFVLHNPDYKLMNNVVD